MNIRKPAVAGQFYGASEAECLSEIAECLPAADLPADLPSPIVGAIVPHAGWVFSGELAARAFRAIRQVNGSVDTFVVFGAAHRCYDATPVVDDSTAWRTPLGDVRVDSALAAEIADKGAAVNPSAHRYEHSIEVQIPFIQHLFPDARIVPIIVPTSGFDPVFGMRVGELIAAKPDAKIVCVASTDLTHYGPRYGFCPEGTGPAALQWAKDVNDARFIEMALRMQVDQMVDDSLDCGSACGPAAAAVVVAAAKALGRTRGVLLGHTTSSDILLKKFHQRSEESVGYAAMVF